MSRKVSTPSKAAGRVGGAKDGAVAHAPKTHAKPAQTAKPASKPAQTVPPMTPEREADVKEAVSKTLGTPDSPTTAPAVPAPSTIHVQGAHMDLTLVRGNVSKNGKKISFSNPALSKSLTFPLSVFGEGGAPESLSLSGDNFKTRSADEQAKAEARNAKRAAKGLKPKLTPVERAQQLEARQAKLAAKLERAQAASAKLAKKLGVTMPTASTPATSAATPEAAAAQ